jgi:hypothetical protein
MCPYTHSSTVSQQICLHVSYHLATLPAKLCHEISEVMRLVKEKQSSGDNWCTDTKFPFPAHLMTIWLKLLRPVVGKEDSHVG